MLSVGCDEDATNYCYRDIIDWLKGILDGIRGGIDVSHSYSDQFIVKLAEERLDCPNFDARLDIRAETSVDLDVNYGFTLIATLGTEGHLVDLRKSYLYFRSRGDITSKFIFDAGVSPKFDTGDIELLRGDKFGAAFAVPGIVTIGPNFKLFGQLEGDATIGEFIDVHHSLRSNLLLSGVKFTAAANFAKWDVRQTFPVENEEFYPVDANGADKSGTQLLHAPEFDLDLQLEGQVTAHIKPTLTFGIDFDEGFLPVKGCAVNLVADGHVTFHAELDDSNSFCYQVDAGADLYATVDAPLTFNWTLPNSTFPILPVDTVQIYPTDGKPACSTVGEELKRAKSKESATDVLESVHSGASRDGEGALDRRANVWGPLMHIEDLICPGTTGEIPACALCHSDESISKRQDGDTNEVCDLDPFAPPAECSVDDALEQTVIRRGANVTVSPDSTESAHSIEKRSDEKIIVWAYNGAKYDLPCGRYEGCAVARGLSGINKWYGFRDLSSSTVCSMDIEKMDSKQTDTSQYVSKSPPLPLLREKMPC